VKTYNEVGIWLLVFLSSALDGGEWLASRPCRCSSITLWRED